MTTRADAPGDERTALVVLDLDGTLYRGGAILARYAREIAARMPCHVGGAVMMAWADHAGGGYQLEGSDDWQALAGLARRVGIVPEALREAFVATRTWMVEGDAAFDAAAGLAGWLDRLRRHAVLAVVSNSPAASVAPVLARLGVDDRVDAIVPLAGKPDGLVPAVRRLIAGHGLDGRVVLSVGDNAVNDVLPALAEGWAAAYVHGRRPPLADGPACQGPTLEQVMRCVEGWLARALGGV